MSLNSKNYYYYYLSSCTEASDVFVLQSFFKATRRLYIEIDISPLRRSEPDIYTTLSCCNPGLHGFKISIFFAHPECMDSLALLPVHSVTDFLQNYICVEQYILWKTDLFVSKTSLEQKMIP